ncbi:MAG: SigB/SigF/SigG family RNA polymerase sigma factor [Solirubrobacteraceae bacterium]
MTTQTLPLPKSRTAEDLIRRYQRHGDVHAREQAVSELMPLVISLCRRYERGPVEWDDLIQVASFGLVKAIERFDPDRGIAISSFAVPTILGEIKRHFRDRTWTVRPPRDLQERALAVSKAVAKLTALHGRSPVPAVVAEHLGLAEEDVIEALVANRAYGADSLDAPAAGADDDRGSTLGDRLGSGDDELSRAEARATLQTLLGALKPRDREILRLRFEEDLTQDEISKRVGVSQMQVSRIIRASVERLRACAAGELA